MKKLGLTLFVVACSHTPKTLEDPYVWLEDIDGKEAIQWVETQNQKAQSVLGTTPEYQRAEKDTLAILEAKDKIPTGSLVKKEIINFWRDETHVRGVLRKASYASYKTSSPRWKTILDIDELAQKENENWVYKGQTCLEPDYKRCMIFLSRGGKDATVAREFDMAQRQFVQKGFYLPEAKLDVSWVDKDRLLVASDFGQGTLTTSGYPRQIKLWKRGTPLEKAELIFSAETSDVRAASARLTHRNKAKLMVIRSIDFFNSEESFFDDVHKKTLRIPKPPEAKMSGYFDGQVLYELRKPWEFQNKSYKAGSVIALSEDSAGRDLQVKDVHLLFEPQSNQSVLQVIELKTKVLIATLEDVKSQMYSLQKKQGNWQPPQVLPLGRQGQVMVATTTDEEDLFLYLYENYNQPSTLYEFNFTGEPQKIKATPSRFDAAGLQVEQSFAQSKDGTRIPYFLIYKKGLVFNGSAPTLQYGYGGFTVSQTAQYNPIVGKLWLEKGGVYVVANIRGGGEYGPSWHQAALKENRQKAFDDFIAVSEDLIRKKITSPARLAIRGGSNGGLLVGAVMTQRPDLYGAVLCWVPLLDMIRYSQLLAGASWMGEYGDPANPQMREVLLKYSPYQNVSSDKKYPPLFLITSTKDDRVHPGHARKMAAKMMAQNHFVMYYENTEGGHGAGANLKQMAKLNALQFEFLMQTIGASLR